MSRKRPPEVYFNALLTRDDSDEKIDDDDDCNTELGELSDGASVFSTDSIDDSHPTDIYGQPIDRPRLEAFGGEDVSHGEIGAKFASDGED